MQNEIDELGDELHAPIITKVQSDPILPTSLQVIAATPVFQFAAPDKPRK
jgi:hypothetical protein